MPTPHLVCGHKYLATIIEKENYFWSSTEHFQISSHTSFIVNTETSDLKIFVLHTNGNMLHVLVNISIQVKK